ncbi:unnamed protein product [Parajaminaea phylloscopi]
MASSSSSGAAPSPVGHTNTPAPASIAQHFPNQLVALLYLQQQQQQQARQHQKQNQHQHQHQGQGPGQGSKKSSASPGPSKLPPLPEASHVNALNLATGSAPIGLPASLNHAVDAALADLSAPQRAVVGARGAGYSNAVIELANEEFRQRWEQLCLAALDDGDEGGSHMDGGFSRPAPATMVPAGWSSAANPGGMGGSWELLAASSAVPPEAGGRPIARSSSRNLLAGLSQPHWTQSRLHDEKLRRRMAQMREAEEWRKNPVFRRTELNVTKLDDAEGIIALAPAWLELDSPDEGIRLDSEIALHALLAYAAYLSIPTFILPPPSSDPARRHLLPHYARAVSAALHAGPGGEGAPSAGSWMTLAVRLPISSPHSLAQILASRSMTSVHSHASGGASHGSSSNFRASDDWAFEAWSQIRHLCGYQPRLQVLLDLSMPLPASAGLARWVAEPVSHIWLPASTFLSNAKGFPVLSKAAQTFLRSLLAKSPRPVVVLSGSHDPPPQHTRGGPTAYLEYLRHLERTSAPENAVSVFARGYADWLQAPLQPLMDNLEGATYEVFERDPIKYALYQEAVRQALVARPAGDITSIWVCGAGRGPLVSRCLAAAADAGRVVRIVALEKNPSAIIALQEKQVTEWGADRVEVRFGDMRTAERPAREDERADILVSELLGSFGDNELSPECLDGACRFLKQTGVSIPSSYTSYLTPLSSAKLHSEVLAAGSSSAATSSGPEDAKNNPCAANAPQVKAAETPFVVLFGAVDFPAAAAPSDAIAGSPNHGSSPAAGVAVQECWTFSHGPINAADIPLDSSGLPISNSHNIRTSSHCFSIPQASLVHGLAGYFEAHLYGNVVMSIHPDPARASKDMLSWFPIYFPLKEPLFVPADGELEVHLWRLTKGRKVWYEWSCEVYLNVQHAVAGGGGGASAGNGTASKRASAIQFVEPTAAAAPAGRESPMLGTGEWAPGGSAFANAPHTPRIPSVALPSDHHDDLFSRRGGSVPTQRQASSASAASATANARASPLPPYPVKATRVKIGMSSLQNPNGRSSWVGM